MRIMLKLPKRKNNRLEGYDYSSAGCYFITICVKNRHEILWDVPVGAAIGRPPHAVSPVLSEIGVIIDEGIKKIERIYDNAQVNRYVIMPNHVHILITLEKTEGSGRPMAAPTMSRIINQLKGSTSKQIGFSIWQKLYHDRIIRNADEYNRIAEYIESNPANWKDDCFYPANREKN